MGRLIALDFDRKFAHRWCVFSRSADSVNPTYDAKIAFYVFTEGAFFGPNNFYFFIFFIWKLVVVACT